MNNFTRLVNEQMETMEKLLCIQNELDRCKEIEQELIQLQEFASLESIQDEIQQMKNDLQEIQHLFEKQTEELIQSYQQAGEAIHK